MERVRGKPHAWDPSVALNYGFKVMSFIYSTISESPAYKTAHQSWNESEGRCDVLSEEPWPVFRVSFKPGSTATLEVEQIKSKVEEERIGLLPSYYAEGVWRRRQRQQTSSNSR